MDSQPWIKTVQVFIEKNSHVSRTTQFKPVLFKIQCTLMICQIKKEAEWNEAAHLHLMIT